MLVDTWRKLPADDLRNVDFDKAAAMLQLGDAQHRLLKSAGANNLAGIAAVLHAAPEIDRQNAAVLRVRSSSRTSRSKAPRLTLSSSRSLPKDSAAILGAIGSGLAGSRGSTPEPLSMARRRGPRRLQLGPVVGHTDDRSTRIWIQVSDDPSRYGLRVEDVGLFPFVSTEFGSVEFGTAIANVTGLQPDCATATGWFARAAS